MREASLQPRPFVVTPIWRGPSLWVERREKVQRWGASTTLMGMRLALQREAMREPGGVSDDIHMEMYRVIFTQLFSGSRSHKHGINHSSHLFPAQLKEMLVPKRRAHPLDAALVDSALQAVMQLRRLWRNQHGMRPGTERLGASCCGEGVCADDEMHVVGAVEAGEHVVAAAAGSFCCCSHLGRDVGTEIRYAGDDSLSLILMLGYI